MVGTPQRPGGPTYNPFADVETAYVPPGPEEVPDTLVPAVLAPGPAVAARIATTSNPAKPVGLVFADSKLENIPTHGKLGRDGTGSAGPAPAPPSSTSLFQLPTSSAPVTEAPQEAYAFYDPRRYRKYFDVDTKDVLWRIIGSFLGPFKSDFMTITQDNPDLYGPFWVATTLVFVTAVAGNYANYIAWDHDRKKKGTESHVFADQWYNDYSKISYSAGLFYGYIFVIGLIFYFVLRYFKGEVRLANVWCIYGYSLSIYIPVSFVCIAPVTIVRWVIIGLATLTSGLFLVSNFKTTIYAAAPARAVLIILVVGAIHLGLGLALKLYFFRY